MAANTNTISSITPHEFLRHATKKEQKKLDKILRNIRINPKFSFLQFIQINPKLSFLQHTLKFLQSGDFENAIKNITTILEENKNNLVVHEAVIGVLYFLRGISHLCIGNALNASNDIMAAIVRGAQGKAVYYYFALARYKSSTMNSFSRNAIEYFEEADSAETSFSLQGLPNSWLNWLGTTFNMQIDEIDILRYKGFACARLAYQNDKYRQEALNALTNVLMQTSDKHLQAEIYFTRAKLADDFEFVHKNYEQAMALIPEGYNFFLNLDLENLEFFLGYAEKLKNKAKFGETYEIYNGILKFKNLGDQKLRLLVALVDLLAKVSKTKNGSKALRFYLQALKIFPECGNPYFKMGILHQQYGNFDYAIKAFTRFLQANPQHALAYDWRAHCYLQLGDHKAAQDDVLAAIQLEPNNAVFYTEAGVIHFKGFSYEDAAAAFQLALLSGKNKALNHFWLGRVRCSAGFYKEAIKAFDAAIALDPTNAEFYYRRGLAKQVMQEYESASADYKRSIEINRTFANAYLQLATCKSFQRKFDTVGNDLDNAIKYKQNSYKALY